MTASFTPTQNTYNELGQFRFWCQSVLPLTYDDSLSYYELLCKVINILNETIQNVELMGDDISKLYSAYEELQTYVNDYFTNLDVQIEINNKLDTMVTDGTFADIVEPFIPALVSAWLSNNITGSTGAIDKSLSVAGAGADAKVVGEEIKNSGKVFRLVTGSPALLDITYADNTYRVKWNTSENARIYGACGTKLKAISNHEYEEAVVFTELTLPSYYGFVVLAFNDSDNTFNLKRYDEVTKDDYVCAIMFQNYLNLLGNDNFFTSFTDHDLYHVRKYTALLGKKCEVLGGSFNINTTTQTVTGTNVIVAYGCAGAYSAQKTFELSYAGFTNPSNIWYMFFNAFTQEYIILDKEAINERFKSAEFRHYYFVLAFLNNRYYGVTASCDRYLINGADFYDNINAPLDLSIARLVTGSAGQLTLSYDFSTMKYKLSWIDDKVRVQYVLTNPYAIALSNEENSASRKCVFTEIESATMDRTVHVVLALNKYTGNLSFKYVDQLALGDYAVVVMFQNYFDFLGNDRWFSNYSLEYCNEYRKYAPFLSKKGEILRGAINIDTAQMKVYTTSSLIVDYGNYGNYDSGITFNFDLSTLEEPNYLWYCMFNSNTMTVDIMGQKEIFNVFNSTQHCYTYMLFAYFNGNIYFTSNVKGIYYINGNDYFAGRDTFTKYNLLSNKTYKIFRKVVCCGDSYTAGYIVDNAGTAYLTNEDYSWVHYMATDSGNNYINCGHSGANVLTWQTAERGLPKAQNSGVAQAYIIGLGLNDLSDSVRHVDVGNINDIGTDNQTYYGGLSKIIRELKGISPKAIIFVANLPISGSLYAQYNQAIKDVVEAYKNTYRVHLLDLYSYIDLYRNPAFTEDAYAGHYTAIGYEIMAQNLGYIMSDYINNHIDEFQDVAFLPYD